MARTGSHGACRLASMSGLLKCTSDQLCWPSIFMSGWDNAAVASSAAWDNVARQRSGGGIAVAACHPSPTCPVACATAAAMAFRGASPRPELISRLLRAASRIS